MKTLLTVVAIVVVYYLLSLYALKNFLGYDLRGLGFNAQSNFINNPLAGTAVVTPNIALFNNSLVPLLLGQITLQVFSPNNNILAQNIFPVNNVTLIPKSQVNINANINIYPSADLLNAIIYNDILTGVLRLRLLGFPVSKTFQFRWTDIH
jgi:hypothetical protein